MIRGIRYQDGMDIRQIRDTGFGLVEYAYNHIFEDGFEWTQYINSQEFKQDKGVADWLFGLVLPVLTSADNGFEQILERASDFGVSYLVIETVGMEDRADIIRLLEIYAEKIKESGMKVYIENGYCFGGSGIRQSAFSEVTVMMETIDRLNCTAGETCFGICLNTGHANLLGRNICGMIDSLGQRIGVLHASDNNGKTSQMQLPYTFTRGRGELSTDWYCIIGALAMAGFKGPVVYDITGLLAVSPVCLRPDWYRLLVSIAQEWESILGLEEYLKEAISGNPNGNTYENPMEDKKTGSLVLFGAGNMFINYMDVWGEIYPPSFIIDNNDMLWGSARRDIGIRPPSSLLEDRENPPHVLICNMYYESIGKQLKAMGMNWRKYDDKYFFRYQNSAKE